MYRWFDSIVSVSDETRRVNLENLGTYYPSPDAAKSVRNVILPDKIRSQAREPIPDGLTMPAGLPVFVMAGRLSPEKAVDRAIQAVSRLRDEGLDCGLVIMGAGPLEDDLKRLVREIDLEDRVVLAGHVGNPFPVIARGDCFLLSSNYEGQPMVLLEALALGKPTIATDIPGARSVLGDNYGHLVNPDVEGVADAMRRFLKGDLSAQTGFDAETYLSEALQEFFDKVLGFTPAKRKRD